MLCPWLAFAQTNDQGSMTLNGQITSATCQFVMSESNVLDGNTIANANSYAVAVADASGAYFSAFMHVVAALPVSAAADCACLGVVSSV